MTIHVNFCQSLKSRFVCVCCYVLAIANFLVVLNGCKVSEKLTFRKVAICRLDLKLIVVKGRFQPCCVYLEQEYMNVVCQVPSLPSPPSYT